MDPLAVIYNEGYWRVNNVSPMYQLQCNEINLKRYSAKIRQDIASDATITSGSQMLVTMENLPLLKYSHEDPNGLLITVSSCSKKRLQTNNKEVYVAILLSWGSFINDLDGDVTHLPYMLERGEKKVGETVKNSMQSMFDCIMRPFNFSKIQLMDFLFNFVDNDTSKSTDPLTLVYKLSPQVNFKDKGSLTFDIGDIRTIWNWVKENTGNESEKKFWSYYYIQRQIMYTLQVDITVLTLCEIALPKAEVKSNGVVKMKTPEIINAVFTALNQINSELQRHPLV